MGGREPFGELAGRKELALKIDAALKGPNVRAGSYAEGSRTVEGDILSRLSDLEHLAAIFLNVASDPECARDERGCSGTG